MSKVLFILKRREDFDRAKHGNVSMSTGLYNSAKFMNDMLITQGIESNLVVVVDNNDIDREVAKYRPTHVIIEALWVVPSKFTVLSQLHPKVKWVIRLHSETPFIANEGMAMDWIGDYSDHKNIVLAGNAPRMTEEVRAILKIRNKWDKATLEERVPYLPNYFHLPKTPIGNGKSDGTLDICCFGAIRPLKNQLLQAIAALKFADLLGKNLNFHINAGRVENKGDAVYRNILCLFQQLYNTNHKLINHQWSPRDKFLDICKEMDIGLQVSFSETFNIVSADLVSVGVPVVGSWDIPWMPASYCADPTTSDDMVNKMMLVYENKQKSLEDQHHRLKEYVEGSSQLWYNYFKN